MKNVEDIWALTPMQEQILVQSLDVTASAPFVEQLHCRLTGPLDSARFRRAWESAIARYAMLLRRTGVARAEEIRSSYSPGRPARMATS